MTWSTRHGARIGVRMPTATKGLLPRFLLISIYVLIVWVAYISVMPIIRDQLLRFFKESTSVEVPSVDYENFPKDTDYNYDLLSMMNIDCEVIAGRGSANMSEILRMENWRFDHDYVIKAIIDSPEKCQTIRTLFNFRDVPASDEEAEYRLAYGILVYRNFPQILFMLSSFYHPQNEYCFAVSGSASEEFKILMKILNSCFNNVYIMDRPPVSWGSFEIINSTYRCMEMLTTKSNWQYFQYLSGVDIPLKTNVEMVRIFKSLNGSANSEFSPFQRGRLKKKNITDSPLPLFKSSLSALVPRAAADYLIKSKTTMDLLNFLHGTIIPDESFWGTVFGNVKTFPVPGSIDAQEFLDNGRNYSVAVTSYGKTALVGQYISRHQIWTGPRKKQCLGMFSSGSCVFGLHDVPYLLVQPHLVAHKLYLHYQPAGYFCMLREIRHRTDFPANFTTEEYGQLKHIGEVKALANYYNFTKV